MFCNQCGAQINDNARFCPKCGQATGIQAPVKKETKKKNVVKLPSAQKITDAFKTFVRGFFSVLCCILIFVFLSTTITLFTARSIVGPNNVKNMLSNLKVAEMVDNTPVERLVSEIDNKEIEKIYHSTKLKGYVEKVALEYSRYLLGGKQPNGLNSKEIVNIMKREKAVIENTTGASLTDNDYDRIDNFFTNEDNVGFLSPDVQTTEELNIVHIVLSLYVLIASLVLTLLFIFLLFLVRKYRMDSFIWASVPIITTSVIYTACCFIGKPIILSLFDGAEQFVIDIANVILNGVLIPVLIIGGTTLLTGVIFILIYIITNKIIKSKKKKEEIKVEPVEA